MLGEDHSLLKEFPEHQETILALTKSDQALLLTLKTTMLWIKKFVCWN